MNPRSLKELYDDELAESEEGCGCDSEEDCECEKCAAPNSQNESFVFDKFVDDILISENKKRVSLDVEESPNRERARMHQERPLGRIKFGRSVK